MLTFRSGRACLHLGRNQRAGIVEVILGVADSRRDVGEDELVDVQLQAS